MICLDFPNNDLGKKSINLPEATEQLLFSASLPQNQCYRESVTPIFNYCSTSHYICGLT